MHFQYSSKIIDKSLNYKVERYTLKIDMNFMEKRFLNFIESHPYKNVIIKDYEHLLFRLNSLDESLRIITFSHSPFILIESSVFEYITRFLLKNPKAGLLLPAYRVRSKKVIYSSLNDIPYFTLDDIKYSPGDLIIDIPLEYYKQFKDTKVSYNILPDYNKPCEFILGKNGELIPYTIKDAGYAFHYSAAELPTIPARIRNDISSIIPERLFLKDKKKNFKDEVNQFLFPYFRL